MYRTLTLSASALLISLAACAPEEPPALSPVPEPEPEEVALDTLPPAPAPGESVQERISAPFAVRSSGQLPPRERRTDVVFLENRGTAPRTTPTPPRADTAVVALADRAASEQPGGGAARDTRAPTASGTQTTPSRTAATPPASTPATTGAGATGGVRQHRVESGETFYGIARRYGITPMALAAVNPGLDYQRLQAGQLLRVPAEGAPTASTPPATPPRPTTPAASPAGNARTHTVAQGETLWGIARRYGVSPDRLRAANNLQGDTVRIGQRLVIPAT